MYISMTDPRRIVSPHADSITTMNSLPLSLTTAARDWSFSEQWWDRRAGPEQSGNTGSHLGSMRDRNLTSWRGRLE